MDLHGQKPRKIRTAKPLAPQLVAPLIHMLAREIMPTRNISHRRPANTNLAQDRQLVVVRPTPTALNTDNNSCRMVRCSRIRRR
jgi:hypothetical protein